MRNTIRMTPMRGFTCAVGSDTALNPQCRAAGVALGIDDSDGERTLIIALRHADGTTLTASLGEQLSDRYAGLLADLLSGDPAALPMVQLQ